MLNIYLGDIVKKRKKQSENIEKEGQFNKTMKMKLCIEKWLKSWTWQ